MCYRFDGEIKLLKISPLHLSLCIPTACKPDVIDDSCGFQCRR